jgi:hypothetical protein
MNHRYPVTPPLPTVTRGTQVKGVLPRYPRIYKRGNGLRLPQPQRRTAATERRSTASAAARAALHAARKDTT